MSLSAAVLAALVLGLLVLWWDEAAFQARWAILRVLRTRGERLGADLAREAGVGRGTVYVHLYDLERRGLVASTPSGDGRRLYRAVEPTP